MAVNADQLEPYWAKLPAQSEPGKLTGHQITYLGQYVDLDVMVAVDDASRLHLLVACAADTPLPANPIQKGLRIERGEYNVTLEPDNRVAGGCFFDCCCTDSSANHNFQVVTSEIAERLSSGHAPRDAIEEVLRQWRWFFASEGEPLSRDELVGLFGELWFLSRWLAPPIDGNALEGWRGPEKDRHDFKSPLVSVEVKTTSAGGTGDVTHEIGSLRQLADPDSGSLYLFSLQIDEDPNASLTVADLVEGIREQLAALPAVADEFAELLGKIGYARSEWVDNRRFSVQAEQLFEVIDGFPRLTPGSFPDGLPAGVQDVRYTLDISACHEFLIATSPSDEGFDEIREQYRGGLAEKE